jgi:eukaryotic-like serine/threonine-protein kinase
MRSDFLDRVGEQPSFMDELTRGLIFLGSPDREGLREALTAPLETVGYRFDSDATVDEMLDALESTPGALPLLQFTAAKLWDVRDRTQKALTRTAYEAMGGVAGALATHADDTLAALSPPDQKLARSLLTHLVTPEGTRAVVDVSELRSVTSAGDEVQRLVDYLVQARLLVIQTRSEEEGASVELVHESLIHRWPTLRRWLDETQEDAAFLAQLRAAAKQWEAKGQTPGLLWRGEAVDEARRFQRRFRGTMPTLEATYLEAVIEAADRAARRRRNLVAGVITVLLLVAVGAIVALVWIQRAERVAREQTVVARKETGRAREAERQVKEQLELVRAKEREKQAAQKEASSAKAEVVTKQVKLQAAEKDLKMSYEQLQEALKATKTALLKAEQASAEARRAADRAEQAATAERAAKQTAQQLLTQERARVQELLRERKKIATELK